ncbi:hypothetical protein D3C72_2594390 [compost metagenome]
MSDGRLLPKEDGIELELARLAGGLSVPVVLDARDQEPEALLWARDMLLERLKPEAEPTP